MGSLDCFLKIRPVFRDRAVAAPFQDLPERGPGEFDIDGLLRYCDVRLNSLMASGRPGFSADFRDAVLEHLRTLAGCVEPGVNTIAGRHNDYSPHNIIASGDGITVSDFGFLGTDSPWIPLLLRPCRCGTFSTDSRGFRTQNRSTANQFYIVGTNGGKKAPPVVDQASSLGVRKRDCGSRMASTEDRAVDSTQWASGWMTDRPGDSRPLPQCPATLFNLDQGRKSTARAGSKCGRPNKHLIQKFRTQCRIMLRYMYG